MPVCWDCSGSRAVPDDLAEDGYGPCPSCVIDTGQTFVVLDDVPGASGIVRQPLAPESQGCGLLAAAPQRWKAAPKRSHRRPG